MTLESIKRTKRGVMTAIDAARAELERQIQMALEEGFDVSCTPDFLVQGDRARLRLVGLTVRERKP